jgi:crotonobetainyl-CoA:carnitine CoA-transferase CaiB-like acyl-CoA transferase
MTGYSDGPPSQIRTSADVNAGIAAAVALLAALEGRRAGRGGCHIDLSAVEAQMTLIGEVILEHSLLGTDPTRTGNDEHDWAPHGCYPCAGTDDWVSIAVESDAEWATLADVLALSGAERQAYATAAQRLDRRRELDRRIEEWTRERTRAEAERVLQDAGVHAVAVLDAAALRTDEHATERGFVAEVPGVDQVWPMVQLGGRLSKTPLRVDWAGPPLGADNDEVLGGVLGIREDERRALAEEGVLT